MTLKRRRIALMTIALCAVALAPVSAAAVASAAAPITASSSLARGTLERLDLMGGVTIEFGDWILTGDTGVYDISSRWLKLSGNVTLETPDGTFTGTEAVYTEADGKLVLDSGTFEATLTDSGKPIYLRATTISIKDSEAHFAHGVVTTCDQEQPHWFLRCRAVELYPSDRAVLTSATLYEFGVPLFWWPFLILPLDGSGLSDLPKVGYTDATGLYLQVTIPYGDDQSGGKVLLDIYQRTGMGGGVEHTEKVSDRLTLKGAAYLFRYWGGEKYWTSLSASLSYRVREGLRLSASAFYKPQVTGGSVSQDEVRAEATIEQVDPKTRSSASYKLAGSTVPNAFKSEELKWTTKHSISDKLSIQVETRILGKRGTKPDSTEVDQVLTSYKGLLQYSLGKPTLNLRLDDWTDATTSTYAITRKERIVRRPELSLEGWQLKVPWSTRAVSVDLAVGDYQYSTGGSATAVSHSRFLVKAEQPSTRLASLGPLSLSYSLAGGYRYYESADELAFASPKATADLSIGAFTGTLTYSLTTVLGYTPLRFDKVDPAHKLTARGSYRTGSLTASVQAPYDLMTQKMDPITLWLRYSPVQRLWMDLSYSYDVSSQRPYSTVIRYNDQRDENKTLRLGVDYSLASTSVTRAEAEISYKLTDTLKLATAIVYDGKKNEWNRGDVALTADLHCRELTLRYDVGKRQIWAEYRLYAFPGEPVKFGLDEDEGVLLETSLFSTQ